MFGCSAVKANCLGEIQFLPYRRVLSRNNASLRKTKEREKKTQKAKKKGFLMFWPQLLLYGIVLIFGTITGYQLGIGRMLRGRINDFASLDEDLKKNLKFYSKGYLFLAFLLFLIGIVLIAYLSKGH